MPLSPATRLGPYEIISSIGAGGMGEVYRARDTRLDRTVAIKVLPEYLSSNPQLRERFDREAKAISSLSHPNICALYDVGHQDGVDFLVMEFLEGETLAHRLKKGSLAPDQALQYAIQITDALDTAHRHGVVHRDLKPGNIMLVKTGAKLLDFGLAKVQAAETAAGMTALPTQTTPLTGEGTILGTLQYMAPEQLEGAEADARTDIFALGAVIYEMATGRKAFAGKSQASLISAIMTAEPPPISTFQPLTPPALDHVVRTCMAKDPEARWQTAHDVLVELKWITEAGSQAEISKPVAVHRKHLVLLLSALLASMSIACLILAFVHFREKPSEAQVIRFQVRPPENVTWEWFDFPVLSPDGRRLVISGRVPDGRRLLWMHSLDSLATEALADTEGAYRPFWSPDSRFVAFFTGVKLRKVEISGGLAQTICEVSGSAGDGNGGTWNQDGVILFGTAAHPLRRVSSDGGEPQPVLELNKSRREVEHFWPQFLPDGRHYLYLALSGDAAQGGIFGASLDSTETHLVVRGESNMSYMPPGFLIYSRQQSLVAQKFDAKSLRVTGGSFSIAEQAGTFGYIPGAQFSASQSRVLAYRGSNAGRIQLAWHGRDGKRLGSIGEPGFYPQIALSPDDKRLAIERVGSETSNLWVLDLASGIFSRLTFNPAGDRNPVWSPDGRGLLFSARGNRYLDLHRKPVGGGEEEVVYQSSVDLGPYHWSKDGWVLFLGADNTFYRVPLAGERKAVVALKSQFNKDLAAVSRDERLVAYESIESGRWEIYVASYPSFLGKRQVSNAGGCQPLWTRDGRELFYLTLDGKLSVVEINGGINADPGVPHILFQAPLTVNPSQTEYAVTGDGQRFIFREPVGEVSTPITVVVNRAAGLKQ